MVRLLFFLREILESYAKFRELTLENNQIANHAIKITQSYDYVYPLNDNF